MIEKLNIKKYYFFLLNFKTLFASKYTDKGSDTSHMSSPIQINH